MGWLDDFAKRLVHPVRWLARGANRARLSGYRVVVCSVVATRRPEQSVLLVRSVYGDWMFPQEGVRQGEEIAAASARGLAEELGIDATVFPVRSIDEMGKLRLPASRRGERPVADDLDDTLMSRRSTQGKRYWAAFIIVAEQASLEPHPNMTEVDQYVWVPLAAASSLFEASQRPEKAELSNRILKRTKQHLIGAR